MSRLVRIEARERPAPLERRLRSAAALAARRHLGRGVVGVAPGLKFRDGRPTGELCVQFLVRKKKSRRALARPLPRFVYARDRAGGVDRRLRFATDVVEVGEPELACGGGAALAADGDLERGTITLIFRNRAESAAEAWYLLTCSHVAGDLEGSPPDEPALASPACVRVRPFATVVKNATPRRRALAYDVALARLSDEARAELGRRRLRGLDRRVAGAKLCLGRWLPPRALRPRLEVECRLSESGTLAGRVLSGPGVYRVRLDGRWLRIGDVYMLDVPVEPGDSGGLVHAGRAAVGIVFARSRQRRPFGWFQPLEPAVAHVARLEPAFELRLFAGGALE